MATRYEVVLLGTNLCGDDVLTLRFSRPEGYSFAPGQWFRLTLPTVAGDVTETFSHCSAPSDPDIEMTTRLSGSDFKNALAALEPGARVSITGAGGRLAIPARAERMCFIVGGVGITPVRSMLRDAATTGRHFQDALLLYGNRVERCMPFAEELEGMSSLGVRVVHCIERPSETWNGERGFITADVVRRHVDPDDGRPFLVAGPPVMVSAIEIVLDELAVPNERRIVEHFGAPVRQTV